MRIDNNQGGLCVQSNALVGSAYSMNLLDKRLLMLAISKVESLCKLEDCGTPISVEVSIQDWTRYFDTKNPITDLKRASKALMDRKVLLYPEEDCVLQDEAQWVDRCRYKEKSVHITFGYTVSQHLAGLIRYSKVKMREIAPLNSIYAIRVLELISQRRKSGWVRISIDRLQVLFNLADKPAYQSFGQINRRCLQPAVEDMQKNYPELQLQFKAISRKGSRATTSVEFSFLPDFELNTKPVIGSPPISEDDIESPVEPTQTQEQTELETLRLKLKLAEADNEKLHIQKEVIEAEAKKAQAQAHLQSAKARHHAADQADRTADNRETRKRVSSAIMDIKDTAW